MSTPITYALLKAARPDAYDNAANDMQKLVDTFEQADVELDQQVYQQLEYAWTGSAASAAISSIGGTVADYQATLAYLNRFVGLLRSAYEGIADAQAYLGSAETIAANNGWNLGEDGQAQPRATADARTSEAVEQLWRTMGSNPEFAEMQDLISRALSTAQAVNDRISAAMADPEQYGKGANWRKDASGARSSAAAMETTLESKDEIPTSADPAEVSAWWTALEQENPTVATQLIKDEPNVIGPLNGIPAPARDQANRLVLADTISSDQKNVNSLTKRQKQLESEIAQLRTGPDAGMIPDGRAGMLPSDQLEALEQQLGGVNGQLGSAKSKLAALTSLQSQLRAKTVPWGQFSTQTPLPPMYLLDFNTGGAGHAIVACGDPDTAKNVAVYVPGLGTSSNSTQFSYDVQHTENMTMQADTDTGVNDTSTILWLGYNAPQLSASTSAFAVAGTGDATDAVPALTSFLSTLHTANQNLQNLTLIGHSYGSLVVGETAQQSHLPVDNIVLIGSPGVEVNKASGLNIDPNHVWAGAASGDPVAQLGYFGVPPTDKTFGGHVFDVGATGSGMAAHGEYFDANNNKNNDNNYSSLENISKIISGNYGQVSSGTPTTGSIVGSIDSVLNWSP